ncbi:branched-chain amino acid aminotransferase [Ancylobacter amanitiformis]|uniref:Probable branched-chain-amino-acid aminotransferase n=1 Tax=Ancylobacter amanitiformis TaxID=217069 RepID=A0ABU0LVK5_9HYPH|nr:branched-chain amino acid aminotransferase [Ancylobacter amanitiformis]MDQ0512767.1 branched-chain amino acid aminotransferase [Ancylobacter amanitiformis]
MSHHWTQTWTFFEGQWHEGNLPIMGVRTHAAWLGSSVFDGARAFEGVTPDLELHCARVNCSAVAMGLKPVVSIGKWVELTHQGLKRFAPDAALYIRPMYWAEFPGPRTVDADPESTRWCLTIFEAGMPDTARGLAVTLSPFRRPSIECAVTDAKAGALYPNGSRALAEAYKRGFDNAVLCDMLGNVAELATANIFLAKDGVAFTPAPNGTFLSGITRTRAIGLLREAGVEVVETALRWDDFKSADEVFTTGNYSKVAPITRVEERELQPGPVFRKARKLYWDFAHG